MKIGPINEMMPSYRDIRQVENKEVELNIQKAGAGQVPEIKENEPAVKPVINDGRETIGVSTDGDVARASREGLTNVNEGLVLRKSPEPAERTEPERAVAERTATEITVPEKAVTEKTAAENTTAEETSGDKTAKVNSLLGYSKDELERLYLQGKINSNQLDKELERRDEIRGENDDKQIDVLNDEKEEKRTNEEVARNMEDKRENGVKEVTERDRAVANIDKEISDKRVEDKAVETEQNRNEAVENRSNENASEENRKRIITEEMGLDNEFIDRMSVLAGAEENDRITSEALDTAVENGRLKIMQEVLGVDPATASEA
jgi:hypothetical protein